MNETDRVIDCLTDEIFTALCYSSNAADCLTPEIRNIFLKLWKDSQDHILLLKSLLPEEFKYL